MKKLLTIFILAFSFTIFSATAFAASSSEIKKNIEKTEEDIKTNQERTKSVEEGIEKSKEELQTLEDKQQESYALMSGQVKAIYENSTGNSFFRILSNQFANKLASSVYAEEMLTIDVDQIKKMVKEKEDLEKKISDNEETLKELKSEASDLEAKKDKLDKDYKAQKEKEEAAARQLAASRSAAAAVSSVPRSNPNYDPPKDWVPDPDGSKLTRTGGVNYYFNQKETYYNLNMSTIVKWAHSKGIQGEYWIREDGCKMLGNYIMVAANLSVHPRYSLVPTSLGMGIVVDTGGFAARNPTQLDIATNW